MLRLLFSRLPRTTLATRCYPRSHWISRKVLRPLTSGVQDGVSCSLKDDSVVINWKNPQNGWSKFHYLWLRDNCLCPQCFHGTTNQRLVDTLQIPLDISPNRVEVSNGKVNIHWKDGHTSEYPLKWLIKSSYEHEDLPQTQTGDSNQIIWGNEIASNPPEVEYSKVMEGDQELFQWLTNIEKYGFCFVRGTPANAHETRKVLADKIGVIRNTFYGDFWSFVADLSKSDTAYTNLAIDLHTDGNYFLEAPGLQVFHCLQFDGTGGQSALVDGFKVAREIRQKNPEHFNILCTVPLRYHHTDSDHKYINSNPVFVLDPQTSEVVRVHFNNTDRMPLDAPSMGHLGDRPVVKLYEVIQNFISTSRDESLQYRFQLEPGKLLVFDNHRLLHARTAYTGRRELCGCYINREDYTSKLMALKERFMKD